MSISDSKRPHSALYPTQQRAPTPSPTEACDGQDWLAIVQHVQSQPAPLQTPGASPPTPSARPDSQEPQEPSAARLSTSAPYGRVPAIALAARNGRVDYLGLLLARGASPKAVDESGRSALQHAAACPDANAARACAERLVRAGACAYAQCETGEDAVFVSLSRGLGAAAVLLEGEKGLVCGCGCGRGPGRSEEPEWGSFEGVGGGATGLGGGVVGSVLRGAPARLGQARNTVQAIVRRVRRPIVGSKGFRRRRSLAIAILFGSG